MQSPQPALPLRDHTIHGVCEGLGEDFRFNPLWLRIVFAASLLWDPEAVVGIYLGLGLIVAVSRWLAPNPRPAHAPETAAAPAPAGAPEAEAREELAVAA